MAELVAPWWKQVDDAAQLIVSTVNAAVARAGRDGVYAPPPGAPPPRRRRHAASLRHLAEVIRARRMAPGTAVDKDVVGRVLAGDLRHLSDPLAVVAVARASHHIAGVPFGQADAQRLTVAVEHLNALVKAAHEADRRAPDLLPVPRPGSELVEVTAVGTLVYPTLPATAARRTGRYRLAAGAALLVVFAAGVLVGVAGSRQTGSSRPAAGATAQAVVPACQPPGAPRASGPVAPAPPGAPVPPGWWGNVVGVGLTTTPTGFVATVPAGSTLPSELIAIRSGITLTAGHRYRFDFTATGDRPLDILLRIQDKAPPLYRPSLLEPVPISRVPCRRSYTFTAVTTSPATGEITFQLGGQGAYTVTVDDPVLVDAASS
jgi:hypothetical protein